MKWTRWIASAVLAGTMATGVIAGTSGAATRSHATSATTLTLWENYGTEQNATATRALVKAFEKLHPTIKINVVSEPAANYFSLLQASAISHNGPDLAVMWTGLFTLQYENFLQNLKGMVPAKDLSRVEDLQWTANDFNAANGPFVVPLEVQFYIGFYNKSAFAKAGIKSVPKTWSQLYSACTALKKVGITPLVYGNGGQALGAEFYPWYDASYLMIGAHSVADWKGLYDGSIPWTSSQNVAQLAAWQKLKTAGCTNPDVLTKTNNIQQFENGKAAMLVDGTWDTAQYTKAMGSKVAAFVPPFSTTPIKGVVEFAGDGFSMTSYSQHKSADVQFLDFLTTQQAGSIVNAAGLIPAIKGMSTSNAVNQEMLDFVNKGGYTPYPMLDNVVQGNVVNTGSKVLPSVLADQESPKAALTQMNQTLQQLPAAQRGTKYAG
ncbi:MAG: carbohydrate transporter substrate-binding protein family [Acidimicrobiaceae bacterium]|jgi:raffinose/stachyose/melibiose transport system substrate-binding protein|nr:carbohydrate transporter substrate-binding protein family [Acidimicrobiaceae bacterium]